MNIKIDKLDFSFRFIYLAPLTLTCILSTSNVLALPSFTEVNAGISSFTEPSGQGIAWIDMDNDGDQDIFIPNSSIGGQSKLYRNNLIPNGVASFTNVSGSLPGSLANFDSSGAVIGDFDGDGWDDIFVTNRFQRNVLLRNNRNSTFSDVTVSAKLNNEVKRSESATFGDVNGDGWIDLYVANWLTGSNACNNGLKAEVERNDLYINNGNGTFTRQNDLGASEYGCSWATTMSDYDQDGDMDIVVINDTFNYLNLVAPPSEIYHNNFKETGATSFTPVELGVRTAGMGIAVGDYDNDQDFDYFQTNIDPGLLSTQFPWGFDTQEIGNGTMHWGADFLDADNDGDLDLYGVPKEYLENLDNGSWSGNQAALVGLSTSQNCGVIDNSCGTAIADYDNDGYMDIVVHENGGDIDLFHNNRVPANNWLKVELKSSGSNHRGIGARVTADLSNGKTLTREVRAGSSIGSSSAFPVHFGLGSSTLSSLTVNWPSGCIQNLNSSVNKQISVTESCVSTVSKFTATDPGGYILIRGTNLQNSTNLRINNQVIDILGFTNNLVYATLPTDVQEGPILIDTPFTKNLNVGIYQLPELDITYWALPDGYFNTSLISVYGNSFEPGMTVLVNGARPFGWQYNSPSDITVISFGGPISINSVTVTTSKGTVTQTAIPTISSVEPFGFLNWSIVDGEGFEFGITLVTVNGSNRGWQVQPDGRVLIPGSFSTSNTIKVTTIRGTACSGPGC